MTDKKSDSAVRSGKKDSSPKFLFSRLLRFQLTCSLVLIALAVTAWRPGIEAGWATALGCIYGTITLLAYQRLIFFFTIDKSRWGSLVFLLSLKLTLLVFLLAISNRAGLAGIMFAVSGFLVSVVLAGIFAGGGQGESERSVS
jgi:hypothetical protein